MARNRNRNRTSRGIGPRQAPAKVENKKGQVMISCPFCFPPHPIITEVPASCGTTLELVAVQNVYTSVECALCGESGGTLVKIGDSYKHDFDCTPGKTIYSVPPPKSRSARVLWNAPDFVHKFVARRWGRAITQLHDENSNPYYGWDMVRTTPIQVTQDG